MLATQQTGILDISAEEYFAIPALSNSGMKDLAVSPLRYWHLNINPERPVREETAAQRLGTAMHCAVLEGDRAFTDRYACALDTTDWPVYLDSISDIREWITSKGEKAKGTRKDALVAQALDLMDTIGEHVPILQEENRRFMAANVGRVILSPDGWRRVCGMARSLVRESVLEPILANGKPEVVMVATDAETGVRLKAKLDWVAPSVTLDLKSFSQMRGKSIDESVCDAIWYEGYHRQAFFYDLVRRLATGDKPGFIEAFVESEEPHETRVKAFSSATLYWQMAQVNVRALIRLYADCWAKYGDRPWRDSQNVEQLADEDIKQIAY